MIFKNALLATTVMFSTMGYAADVPGIDPPSYAPEPTSAIPYDLSYPYAYFELDDLLKKVSGLSPCNDPNSVASLQENEGKIYSIDKKTGKINGTTFFVTEGEFQALEYVKDTVFAMKGNGQMYKIWNLKGAQKNVKMVKTNLPKTSTYEGLAYDVVNNRLLITAKGQKEGEFTRQIYAFDVKTNQVNPEPAYEISLASFKEFLTDKKDKNYAGLRVDYVEKASTKGFDFAPSSVAVHPMTNNIYVLSSVNNVLLVLNQQGEIQEMTKLKKDQHFQPEGICFDEEGTMFIANSSKDGKPAKLFEYKMQKTAITASRR